jgi:hypothetical protein
MRKQRHINATSAAIKSEFLLNMAANLTFEFLSVYMDSIDDFLVGSSPIFPEGVNCANSLKCDFFDANTV